jgi:dihydroorotate dehydrogenase (fumarate)
MTISSILASSPISAVRQIGIIGVGGVTSSAAYKRMMDAGAAAVACATALGVSGIGIFGTLRGGEVV